VGVTSSRSVAWFGQIPRSSVMRFRQGYICWAIFARIVRGRLNPPSSLARAPSSGKFQPPQGVAATPPPPPSLAVNGLLLVITVTSTVNHATRVRPKFGFGFGFGYGAETDLTCGFCLVSATAKVHWHKFGFGRNMTSKNRNLRYCKIGANCNTGSLAVRLLAVGGQGGAYASWYRRPDT